MRGTRVTLKRVGGRDVQATLDLYFVELPCHICGKEMLCVLADNSDLDNNSIPICKECLCGLFAEAAKSTEDDDYTPSIKERGWEHDADGGQNLYSKRRG